jgi:hypothetical protein
VVSIDPPPDRQQFALAETIILQIHHALIIDSALYTSGGLQQFLQIVVSVEKNRAIPISAKLG